MSIAGTMINGGIVLDEAGAFPDGARVEVALKTDAESKAAVGDRLLALAGLIDDGPEDFAEQHDHYVHGTAKR